MKQYAWLLAGVGVMALGLSLASCSSGSSPEGGSGGEGGGGESYSIVYLAASAQNGYNQAVFTGIEDRAKELEDELGITIEAKLQDGQFDANTQLSQLQNAGTTGQADGIIVVPHDGVVLTAAFPLANDVPVVPVLNPIGPDIAELEPQVDGVVSTVATAPTVGAKMQAESAVEYCADIDPCKIGLIAGFLNTPLDVTRVDAWKEVFAEHDNIEVVGTLEGQWDRDASLTAVSNLLQANKDINGIMSGGDQMTMGAQVALEAAGIDPASIFLTGAGGTEDAVQAVRDGKWTNTYLNFPYTMGKAALDAVIAAIRGEEVETVINGDALGGIGPIADKAVLDENPDFTGEWNG